MRCFFFKITICVVYSDAPLDLKIKASMIADMFSLVGECMLGQRLNRTCNRFQAFDSQLHVIDEQFFINPLH